MDCQCRKGMEGYRTVAGREQGGRGGGFDGGPLGQRVAGEGSGWRGVEGGSAYIRHEE